MPANAMLAGVLPWWLLGYLAAAQLLCALCGLRREAKALAQAIIGIPVIALCAAELRPVAPFFLWVLLLAQWLLVVLVQASRMLFGSHATSKVIDAMLAYVLLGPLLWLAARCWSAYQEPEPQPLPADQAHDEACD